MTNFRIEKTREYVWRIYNWGSDAGHNHITAWHVVNADTGERIYGGHVSGNNCHSGYAHIPRRKDAKAYIAGFNAFERGEVAVHSNGQPKLDQYPVGMDEDETGHWQHGVYCAFDAARRTA